MESAAAYRRPDSPANWPKHLLLAAGAVLALLALLLFVRLIGSLRQPGFLVTEIDLLEPSGLPPPPEALPPPESISLPPPPLALPHLQVEINPVSPPFRSAPAPPLDFRLNPQDFALDTPPVDVPPVRIAPAPRVATTPPRPSPDTRPRPNPAPQPAPTPPRPAPPVKSVYPAGELDGKPTLRNHPSPPFPRELSRRGITQGRAVLDIEIDPSGRVTVRGVISISHPELRAMALETARRARFTTPKKDGKPVRARFRWPLILKQ
ncbi:MAG TPA: energy transducer TonB [Verrucomicrobiales bacterium]|nr:energy transducer TonB [Verrucomicrobiales bacterium]